MTAVVDPFLSPYQGRRYESVLQGDACTDIDVVLCTHEHLDHLDPELVPVIARVSPQAVFVVPTPIVDMVTETGIAPDRVVGLQPDETLEVAGLAVRAVPARHGVTMEDAYGFGEELSGGLVRFLGYVLDVDGVRIYHAGDTIHFEGMETTMRAGPAGRGAPADQRQGRRTRGARRPGQLERARGGLARGRDRRPRAGADAPRPVRGQPRLAGARRGVGRARGPPRDRPGTAPGHAVRTDRRSRMKALMYLGPSVDGVAGRPRAVPGPGRGPRPRRGRRDLRLGPARVPRGQPAARSRLW